MTSRPIIAESDFRQNCNQMSRSCRNLSGTEWLTAHPQLLPRPGPAHLFALMEGDQVQ